MPTYSVPCATEQYRRFVHYIDQYSNIENILSNPFLSGVQWYHLGYRVRSLNFDMGYYSDADGKLHVVSALSSSNVTDGSRCPVDGIVLTFIWDNAIHGTQVCFGTGSNTGIYKRQYTDSVWGDWYQV